MTVSRYTRDTAPYDWLNYDEWDTVSTEGYDENIRANISRLTQAIKNYIDGEPYDTNLAEHGIYRQTLLRAFNRCITPSVDGRLFGWRALLPWVHVRPSQRHTSPIASGRNQRGGLSGSLTLFWRTHKEIASKFQAYLLATAKRLPGHEARLHEKSAHQKFIALCQEGGVQEWQWPLNTRRLGRESIRKYLRNFLELRYDDIVATQFGSRAKAKSHTGTGYDSRLVATRPYDIVEIDEHKCGFIGSIGIPTPEGIRWIPMERVTIILVVDRWLRLILGYKIVFRREANADDAMDALNSAMGNGAPRFSCDGYEQEFKGGLPCELGAPFTWCGWNLLLFDNALIHLATEVSQRARSIIGCDINFGPVRRFERRATVEGVFGGLERMGFRRLPNTVGTNPQDPVRQRPDKTAAEAKVPIERVLTMIEEIIIAHNGRVSKSNFGSTPMGRLEASLLDVDGYGVIFPVLPPLAVGVAGLDVSLVPLTIHGGMESGRRPYFTFEGETYTGRGLARQWSKVKQKQKQKVVGHVKRDAIREIQIFTESGAYLDTARVMGRWRHTEHSRDTRKHINALVQSGQLSVGYMECPVHRYLASIVESVSRNSGGRANVSRKDRSVIAGEQTRGRFPTEFEEEPQSESDIPVAEEPMTSMTSTSSHANDGASAYADDHEDDDFLDYSGLTAFDRTTS